MSALLPHAQIFGTYDVSSPRASKWRCCLVHGFSLSVEKRWRAEWSSAVHILFFRTPRSLRLGSHIIDRVDGDREETSRRLLLADIRVIRGMRNIDLPTSSETQNVPVNKIAWTQINPAMIGRGTLWSINGSLEPLGNLQRLCTGHRWKSGYSILMSALFSDIVSFPGSYQSLRRPIHIYDDFNTQHSTPSADDLVECLGFRCP
ncbi:hypothetical protein CC1G_15652 [Coprinopsis cinerea okayama7|uniref:Uncharacterized protein n=1 Tax=Coprinopsis cinerea (strain Okayama-7 / 130 / ATCC MYA-4618 / FGSC 9003) TaxID=240176 RepID=D6RQB3_COPC7|nr:hypothetical protein CC1G_15652 [Coprinopsis cinerea okayama7\|eukprot:XP_002910223.1 hypothetical protein CC1G_15652 [Coprinopsis cinerea okayama7\